MLPHRVPPPERVLRSWRVCQEETAEFSGFPPLGTPPRGSALFSELLPPALRGPASARPPGTWPASWNRLKDVDGRMIALRLWKRQLRTLVNGTSGLVEALEE